MKKFHISLFFTSIFLCINIAGAAPISFLQEKLGQLSSQNTHFSYSDKNKINFLIVSKNASIKQPYNGKFSSNPEKIAINFLNEYSNLFAAQNQPEYRLIKDNQTNKRHSIKLRQTHQGIPIFAAEMVVRMNEALEVTGVNGEISSNLENFLTKPSLTKKEAQKKALILVSKQYQVDINNLNTNEPELWIYNPLLLGKDLDKNQLVWRLEVTSTGEYNEIKELVMVDAITGNIALNFSQIMHAKNRNIYDNENTPNSTLPGTAIVRGEGGATVNTDVDTAYDYSGDTYDFYFNHHGRDSLDNKGMTLISTVRHCPSGESCPFANAYWNGSQMAYGSGFSVADDVVGHELTHGVTSHTSNLIYLNQSGAINESFSDVWGEFIDLTNTGGTDTASVRWKMGEDVPSYGAIRNMAHPEDFNDPDKITSSNYYCGSADAGGVHTNSGVNNKAAYLMADGDTFNGITVSGIGIVKTAKIYYEAQTNILTSGSTYQDLYNALQVACTTLTGTDGITTANCTSVKNALDAVEMNTPPCTTPPAPICSGGLIPNDVFYEDLETGLGAWSHASNQGPDAWSLSSSNPATGSQHIHGNDASNTSDSYISNTTPFVLPSDAYMHFEHYYNFESGAYDGGVVEYSLDNGTTWTDAGSLITHNAYSGTLYSGNALGVRDAFINDSMGTYTSSRLDLSSLSGSNFKFRFRIGTDSSSGSDGWDIDNVRVYTCGLNTPAISSPTSGSTLSGTTQNFYWAANGVSVSDWWLYVGTSLGAHDILDTGSQALATTSYSVTGLPSDGSTVYAQLWYKEGTTWKKIDSSYTAYNSIPEITSPTNGSVMSGASATFSWSNNIPSINNWWLYVGSTPGAKDISDSGSLGASTTSYSITNLPTDGSAIYAQLWYKEGSASWKSVEATYTAHLATPKITSPSPGSTLSGSTATFSWTPDTIIASEWWLYVGSNAGAKDIVDSGSLNTSTTSYSITNLPVNGSTVYLKLWYKEGSWKSISASYTAYSGAADDTYEPDNTPSTAKTILPSETQTHSISQSGSDKDWVTFSLTATSNIILETNGSSGDTVLGLYNSDELLLVEDDDGGSGLFSKITYNSLPSGVYLAKIREWGSNDDITSYQLDLSVENAVSPPAITSPENASSLSGTTEIFSWNANGTSVSSWWLYVGNSLGAHDILDSGSLSNTTNSVAVSNLPNDGSAIYVRLYYKVGGTWESVDTTYVAIDAFPEITAPSSGSTLTGSSQLFSWIENDANVTDWWLYAGTTIGAFDLADTGSLGLVSNYTLSGLPVDGSTIYIRLWYKEGSWKHLDYSYTAV